ncbi:MAG: HNH endonuclease [Rhodospirillaceae bacterium]|nr:HNH endonuclease [Rhodospirillaceae bacterium]
MSSAVENCPTLVLNADFRPLSYFPLSLWSWQDALKAVFLERVNVVSEYDTVVRSPSFELKLPSVISLKKYAPTNRSPAFTRFNVFLRDYFTCQYCGVNQSANDLTFDHVVPRSRGGRTTWQNVAAACSACNLHKANRTPQEASMTLRRVPAKPTARQLQECGRAFPPDFLHKSWRDFLYWDSELEPW